jgi:opacity protein-like surface antigen
MRQPLHLVLAFSAILAGTLAARSASAQIAPYAMFSAGHYSGLGVGPGTGQNQSGGITSLGGTLGLYDNFLRLGPARLGSDFRAVIQNSANSTPYGNKLAAGLLGLRLDLSGVPVLPFVPYVQAELGLAGTNNGTNTSKSTSFAYQVQLGGDFSVFPHVAARLEYGTGQLVNTGPTNHTLQTFGAGIVVRL